MRIAPMAIPHLQAGTTDLWVDTALSAAITHNDSGSTAACLSFHQHALAPLGHGYAAGADVVVGDLCPRQQRIWRLATVTVRAEERSPTYRGTIWRFVQERLSEAYRRDLSVLDACNEWFSGAYLLETVPSVLYILMRHGDDPEEAIVRAVNDTKDNDTIAAIVGAAVGRYTARATSHPGGSAICLAGLQRTTMVGSGSLLREARSLWWK